ncbi:MAG TPA: hypothetical protein VLW52_11110 [Opitutaceae bacterium]|nr:hypothetical protein [Opitutaceae bacterium]
MKDFDARWQRLVAAARQAPAAEDVAAPYGFATRIAARALGEPERPALLAVFGRLSIRALWVAGLLMLVSMAANYLAFAGNDDDDQSLIDPVSEVLASS